MVMNVLRIITSDDPFGFRCVAVGPRTLLRFPLTALEASLSQAAGPLFSGKGLKKPISVHFLLSTKCVNTQ